MRGVRLLVLVVAALTAGGCVNRVTGPGELVAPVTVYVADHGKHSSLLLPASGPALPGEPRFFQYAYGDWHCYALNNNAWHDYLRAAFLSGGSALGREPVLADEPAEIARVVKARLTPLRVERSDADWLRRRLDAAFARRADEAIDNRWVSMTLVPYDGPNARYSLLNQCNHTTSRWLRELNVASPRAVLWSRFELRD